MKRVLITGAASGLGRALALRFAQDGADICIADINREGSEETLKLIGEAGGSGWIAHLDVRVPEQWEALRNDVEERWQGLDVLVNNAGVATGDRVDAGEWDWWEWIIDINLKGVLFGAQAALPHLQKTAPGSCLLNTASAAGIYGTSGASVYSATKFGVRALTESLDAEWAQYGINVRSIMPSFIDTPLIQHNPNGRSNASIKEQVMAAGLEITPVSEVGEAAWQAVHGDKLHTAVGKTAKRVAFASRWMPGKMRKEARKRAALGVN